MGEKKGYNNVKVYIILRGREYALITWGLFFVKFLIQSSGSRRFHPWEVWFGLVLTILLLSHTAGEGLKFYDILEGKGPAVEKGQSVLVVLCNGIYL